MPPYLSETPVPLKRRPRVRRTPHHCQGDVKTVQIACSSGSMPTPRRTLSQCGLSNFGIPDISSDSLNARYNMASCWGT